MRQIATNLAAALIIANLLGAVSAVKAQGRWAAIASDDDSESPVVWAESKDEAVRKALAACKKVADTCGDRPASTPDMSHIFTVMCCNKPRHGCAIGVDKTRDTSLAMVQKVFDDAGFSSCKVIRRMSAQTGRRVD